MYVFPRRGVRLSHQRARGLDPGARGVGIRTVVVAMIINIIMVLITLIIIVLMIIIMSS